MVKDFIQEEVGECRREVVYWLIEGVTKLEEEKGGREMVDVAVVDVSHREMSERGWEVVHGVVEGTSKCEMGN